MTLKESIVKEVIKPKFKEEGFRISGNHYRKEEQGFIKVFNPQFSMYNDPKNIRLTFNMGLYFPSTTKFENKIEPNKLSIHDCQFEERYGHLCTSSGNDYWIEKNNDNTITEFETEVKNSVDKSLDWFNQFKTIESLETLSNHKFAWNHYRVNYDIALYILQENHQKALSILESEINLNKDFQSKWAETLSEVYRKIKKQYDGSDEQ